MVEIDVGVEERMETSSFIEEMQTSEIEENVTAAELKENSKTDQFNVSIKVEPSDDNVKAGPSKVVSKPKELDDFVTAGVSNAFVRAGSLIEDDEKPGISYDLVKRATELKKKHQDIWFACSICFRAFRSINEISEHKKSSHSSEASKMTQSNIVSHADMCFIIGDQEMLINVFTCLDGRHLLVRNSPIHGRGLYTGSYFHKNEIIVEYTGEKLSRHHMTIRKEQYEKYAIIPYIINVEDNEYIDATVIGNCARFANFSCSPNMIFELSSDKKAFFVANRDIFPSEELVYSHRGWSSETIRGTCNCRYKYCHNVSRRGPRINANK